MLPATIDGRNVGQDQYQDTLPQMCTAHTHTRTQLSGGTHHGGAHLAKAVYSQARIFLLTAEQNARADGKLVKAQVKLTERKKERAGADRGTWSALKGAINDCAHGMEAINMSMSQAPERGNEQRSRSCECTAKKKVITAGNLLWLPQQLRQQQQQHQRQWQCQWQLWLLHFCIVVVLLRGSQAAPNLKLAADDSNSSSSDSDSAVWPPMHHYDIWNADLKSTPVNEEAMEQPDAPPLPMDDDDLERNNIPLQDDYSAKLAQSVNQTLEQINVSRRKKVIHLFPVPVDGECLSDDGRRLGNCFNAYECRQKGGTAKGECAMGFGVCCVFVADCNSTITNNITYIVSPQFPSFMPSNFSSCRLKVKMMSEDISQLRIDFYHFSLGQPNRRTGVCDGDVFNITGGPSGPFALCGQNSGQHLYYDVSTRAVPRQSSVYGSLRPLSFSQLYGNSSNITIVNPVDQLIEISLNFSTRFLPIRLWEIRVAQIPFSQRAPAGCLQYHTGVEGVMQTFNFADNGRHLANQHYRICVRQETDMCSIMYQPCDEQSFRIGGMNTRSPAAAAPSSGSSSMIGAAGATGGMAPSAASLMQMLSSLGNITTTTAMPTTQTSTVSTMTTSSNTTTATPSSTTAMSVTTAAPQRSSTEASTAATTTTTSASPLSDDVEGSGGDDGGNFDWFGNGPSTTTAQPGVSRRPRPIGGTGGNTNSGGFDILSFLRTAFDIRIRRRRRQGRQFFSTCTDRITMPCIIEDFIGTGLGPLPGCEPVHCGSQFCSSGVWPCRIESTVTPFYIGVHFGDGTGSGKGNAEDNIGACLRFAQVQCM